jgi:putative glutathione S-transferase
MRSLFRIDGVAATVDFGHIKRHYYQSHRNLNPSGIVPVVPELAFVPRGSVE